MCLCFYLHKKISAISKSLILPHLDYCGAVWGSIDTGLSNKLQNTSADTIVGANCFVESYHLLSDLNWTRLADRRTKQMDTLMSKTVNGQLPEYISERFKNTNTIHRSNLRESELNLFILRPNSEARKKSFR